MKYKSIVGSGLIKIIDDSEEQKKGLDVIMQHYSDKTYFAYENKMLNNTCVLKLEILENADDLLNIREIRNQIAHEYVESNIRALFHDVLGYVPLLEKIIDNLINYYNKHLVKAKEKEWMRKRNVKDRAES